MAGTWHWLKYFLPLKTAHPIYLIYFVTSRCMGQCRHCFYWRSLNQPENPLGIDEVEKMSRSMGGLLQLTLTGGEPLLREDLAELIKIFCRNNHPFNLGLATSGFYPDKLEKVMAEVLKQFPGQHFTLGLPIEGPPELNDEIRGVKGFFARTEASIKLLKELKKSYPRLTVLVDITASRLNQEHLAESYMLVRDQLKPDLINLIITRGNPKQPQAGQIEPHILRQVTGLMEDDVRAGKIPGYGFNTRLLHAKDLILRRTALAIFQGQRPRLHCRAGDLIGVVYPEGRVYPCELWQEAMGELRAFDYDLKKIWRSGAAEKIRKQIRERNCLCWHQCFLSPSLFFDPLFLPSLFREAMKQRAGK
jgi:radical SAM protein with 4Fe4S-binding SPASM domain